MCCLTLNPEGGRSIPAMACSCQATCHPAEMPVIVIFNVPVNFTLYAVTCDGLNGKSDGWLVIRREIAEDGDEEVSWTSHSRLHSWALIGRAGLLQQLSMAPCLQLKVPSCKIYAALDQKPRIPLPRALLALSWCSFSLPELFVLLQGRYNET